MADIDLHQDVDAPPQDEYSNWEIVLWIVGILSIPGVPILMVRFLTPFSGM
ncbi:MAG TPA: hypothetical protein VHG51_21120 [Longimicrobiaceae bacterium]|nr:hypothetical protein [Longimicrobiaceae bacterium]